MAAGAAVNAAAVSNTLYNGCRHQMTYSHQMTYTDDRTEGNMFPERTGYIIWVSDLKAARNLEKYGSVHYLSRRMHYVVMYVNADRAEDTIKNIRKLSYVRKIERSYRNEIKTEYSKDTEDKTRYYGL
ncbi:hypothetical protein D3C80_1184450 [compost metagenome]